MLLHKNFTRVQKKFINKKFSSKKYRNPAPNLKFESASDLRKIAGYPLRAQL